MKLRARMAKESDFMLIFNWINDPFVRSMSFDRSFITLETYKEEFQKVMSQQNTHLLIIEQHEDSSKWIPIAQVHIDKDGEITMSLASEFRGKHLAKPVIKAGIAYIRRYPSIKKLVAHIKDENITSVKAFEKAGFRLNGKTTFRGHQCLEYIYNKPNRKFGLFY